MALSVRAMCGSRVGVGGMGGYGVGSVVGGGVGISVGPLGVRTLSTVSTMESRFFQDMPKVELHRHLEGAVRLTTVLDEGIRHNIELPSRDLEGLRPHIQTLEPFQDLASLLAMFDNTQITFKDMSTFRRIAYEAVEDAYLDGIRLFELRYAPSFCSMNHDHNFEPVLAAIQEGVALATAKYDIKVGLICIAVGAMGVEEVDATVDFLLDNRSAFVGFDMAGAETDLSQWKAQFKRVHDAGIPITCHAAEEGPPENALIAINDLHASRIGHGIQIFQCKDAMDAIREHGALLEVSVTSNWLTSNVSAVDDHPARHLWDHGIPLNVNTDDPGIMNVTLSEEYKIWHDRLGFTEDCLRTSNIHALDHSFLPEEDVEYVREKYFPEE